MLTAENLQKSYGDKLLFDSIDVLIKEDEGTGLKALAALEEPDKEDIIHPHDERMEYVAQKRWMEEGGRVIDYMYAGDAGVMVALRQYEHALFNLENDPNNEKFQEQLMKKQQLMDKYNAWEAGTVAKTVLTQLGVTTFEKRVKYLSCVQQQRDAIEK